MATFFIDLDGVVFKFGTMVFNEGAVEFLRRLKANGHQIVFSTARKPKNNNVPSLQLDLTIRRLKEEKLEYDSIVGSLSSPRIVINDQGAFAIEHEKDAPIDARNYMNFNRSRQVRPDSKKILNSLLAMAWTSKRHGGKKWSDSDEYVQTILIARSLLRCKGFNHSDIVKTLASDPGCLLENVGAGGLSNGQLKNSSRKGAIWKLVNNFEK